MKVTTSNLTELTPRITNPISITSESGGIRIESGDTALSINSAGARVLLSLLKERSIGQAIAELSTEYRLDQRQATSDALEFLREIYRHGLLSMSKDGLPVDIPAWRTRPLDPTQVMLTRRCNLRCAHCYLSGQRKDEMAEPELTTLFRQIARRGGEFVHFTGGEVFLRKDVLDVFALAVDAGLDFGFNTNGSLVNQKVALRLVDLHPSDVCISLYGHTASLHAKMTQDSSVFEETTRAIRICADTGLPVTVKTMVTCHNVAYLHDIEALAMSLGAQRVLFDPFIFARENGDRQPWEYRLPPRQLLEFDKGKYGGQVRRQERRPKSPICNAGINRIAIDCDGTAYPCASFHLPIGNVRTKAVDQIIGESPLMREYVDHNRFEDLPDECQACSHFHFCIFCPGASYVEQGSFKVKCEFACSRTKMLLA